MVNKISSASQLKPLNQQAMENLFFRKWAVNHVNPSFLLQEIPLQHIPPREVGGKQESQ